MNRYLVLLFLVAWMFAACTSTEQTPAMLIRLQVDGTEYIYQYTEPITVSEFLNQANVTLDELDRVYPEAWTQIYDQMRITVVRVSEQEYCEDEEIPFRQQRQLTEGITEEQVGVVGQNGVEKVCYRVRVENNVQQDPVEISRVLITPPIDEVVYVSPSTELDAVVLDGALAYIGNGNIWIIRGDTSRKRLLTTTGDLDRRVFSLSSNGRQLLFTRRADSDSTLNELWYIPNTISAEPQEIQLIPQDVLTGEWIPNRDNTFSYSAAERQRASPGWRAYNDLWFMTIDPDTGQQIRIEPILEPSSTGIASWWGTEFAWSPEGDYLAWIRADAVGLVDIDNNRYGQPLIEFEYFDPPQQDWSWRTDVSWSAEGDLLVATTHGAPESSAEFNIGIVAIDGDYTTTILERTGIWSTPQFSPLHSETEFPDGYLAYLEARQWETSINSEYDLIVADRDGSNARRIFPPEGQTGLRAEEFAQDFTWSPDGQWIALIYLGNLWLIDVQSELAYQVTQDGKASNPVWAQ